MLLKASLFAGLYPAAFKVIQRSLVNVLNINVLTIKSIKIKSANVEETALNPTNVTWKIFDDNNQQIDYEKEDSLKVHETRTNIFTMNYQDCKENLSIELKLPMDAVSDINLGAGSADIYIENLQTRQVNVISQNGDIVLKNMKGDLFNIVAGRGLVETKGLLLGQTVCLTSKNGGIKIQKVQGENLSANAKGSVDIDCCYTNTSTYKSTSGMYLKNLHGNTDINLDGGNFFLSGFSGNLKANLNCDSIDCQLSELYGDNNITIKNPKCNTSLGLAEAITQTCNLNIESTTEVDSTVFPDITITKNDGIFHLRNEEKPQQPSLKINSKGKSFSLTAMSWIDSLKLKKSNAE